MDYRLFRQLISNKGTEEKQELTQLQEFVREYPYCQTGHLLLAKSMHLHDHVGYEQQLKRTAACVPDRTVLFNLIHSIQAFPSDSPLQLEDVSPFKTEEQPLPIFVDQSAEDSSGNLFSDINFNSSTAVKNDEVVPASNADQLTDFMEEDELIDAGSATENSSASDPYEAIRLKLEALLEKDASSNSATNESVSMADNNTEPVAVSEWKESNSPGESENIEVPVDSSETPLPVFTDDLEITSKNSDAEIDANDLTTFPEEEKEKKSITTEEDLILNNLELEYAMEGSILKSIEALPPIEIQEQENVMADPEPTTGFFNWLKQNQVQGFGVMEEITSETAEVVAQEISFASAQSPNAPETNSLIDRFIQSEPRIVPQPKVEFFNPSIQAKRSIEEHDDLVSETLAKIYADQGNLSKARKAYINLSLLHPQKSAYFATLIQQIDNQLNSNSEDL
mgnify:CR=1 FL=1